MGLVMLLLGSLLAAVTHATAVSSDLSSKQANKFRKHLDCNGFETTFTVTKSMLYDQAKPPASDYFYIGVVDASKQLAGFRRDNWGCKGKFRPMTRPRGQQVEMAATFTLDWFDENDLNNCGIKLTETINNGINGRTSKINVEFIIFGDPRSDIDKVQDVLPNTSRVIQVECEVARTVDEWTYKYQNDPVLSTGLGRGATIKKSGLFKSDVFETYDVRTGFTRAFHPYTSQHRMAKPGEPMLVGVRPKPDYRWGTNYNPIAKHGKRWRFYTDNCVWSGLTDQKDETSSVNIELINGGCKSVKYNVEILSKYGRNKDGNLFMFEAMGFGNGNLAYLTCSVKICLVDRLTGQVNPSCQTQPATGCDPVGIKGTDNVYYMNPTTGETDCDPTNVNIPCVLVEDGDRLGAQNRWIEQKTYELTTTPAADVFTTVTDAAEPTLPAGTTIGDAPTALLATTSEPATVEPAWVQHINNHFGSIQEAWAKCEAMLADEPHRFFQKDRKSHPFFDNKLADGSDDKANYLNYEDEDLYDVTKTQDDENFFKVCQIIDDHLAGMDYNYYD